ncbi:SRPBCC family protein [Streptomyces alkaliphilus]|uniref:SRPBCC family protein n=1 Tax=Streptomyces alkaliphilus TaxID=1472722 RepID=UPI001566193E
MFPKFMFGKAGDDLINPFITRVMPREAQRRVMALLLRMTVGKVTDYGLPEPGHKLFNAHPTVSEALLPRLGHGGIGVKPNISHFDGDTVHFVDGSSEVIDAVIHCTGYKVGFPFLDPSVIAPKDNDVSLFHRVVDPRNPGLYFIGLFQPLGATTVLAEAQSHWVADLIEGKAALPSEERMNREITRYKEGLAKRYVNSTRHTMQVDHYPYLAELGKARRVGARLARKRGAGSPAPVPGVTTAPRPEEVSIRIDASPEQVWDLISDVTRMGEWSPECRRCYWRGGTRGGRRAVHRDQPTPPGRVGHLQPGRGVRAGSLLRLPHHHQRGALGLSAGPGRRGHAGHRGLGRLGAEQGTAQAHRAVRQYAAGRSRVASPGAA